MAGGWYYHLLLFSSSEHYVITLTMNYDNCYDRQIKFLLKTVSEVYREVTQKLVKHTTFHHPYFFRYDRIFGIVFFGRMKNKGLTIGGGKMKQALDDFVFV